MSQVFLDCDHIGDLASGAFRHAVDKAIQRIIADIDDAPVNWKGKAEKRKLTIQLEFEPIMKHNPDTNQQELVGIGVQPKVEPRMPGRAAGVHDVRVVRGRPCFNVDAPADFYQTTLDYDDADVESDL